MSAFTTLYISRNKARKVLRDRIDQLSDSDLVDFVDRLTEPRLYRVTLDGEVQGRNDKQLERIIA